jgi:hypothetical protein
VFRFEGVEDNVLLRENVMNLHPGDLTKSLLEVEIGNGEGVTGMARRSVGC